MTALDWGQGDIRQADTLWLVKAKGTSRLQRHTCSVKLRTGTNSDTASDRHGVTKRVAACFPDRNVRKGKSRKSHTPKVTVKEGACRDAMAASTTGQGSGGKWPAPCIPSEWSMQAPKYLQD